MNQQDAIVLKKYLPEIPVNPSDSSYYIYGKDPNGKLTYQL